MKRAQSMLFVVMLAPLLLVAGAPACSACSVQLPPSLDEIVETRTAYETSVTGVFEVEHIAYAPNIGVRTARSVSVVTRYWGEPPPNLGRVSHGEFWFGGGSSCGNGNRDLGEIIYSWTDGTEENRGQFSGISTYRGSARSKLSPDQEARLTAVFGEPVELSPSAFTRSVAWAQIWWLPTLLGMAIGTIALLPLRRHVLVHAGTARERFSWYPLAVGALVAAGIPLLNRLHEDVSLDMTPGWAVVLLLAIAAGTALSPPITAWVVGALWLGLAHNLSRDFGDVPFRGLTFSSHRLSAGITLTLLGLGLLVASRRHWARWIGFIVFTTGFTSLASALWPLSGRISWFLIVPTTLAAGGLALWFGRWVLGGTTPLAAPHQQHAVATKEE